MTFATRLGVLAAGVRDRKIAPLTLVRQLWPDVLLDNHQQDIIAAMIDGWFGKIAEIVCKGCTGAGKGAAVAIGANLWFELSEHAKIVITSVRYEHAVDVLFSEVTKWRKSMVIDAAGEITATAVRVDEEKWIRPTNPNTGEGFSGIHGPNTLMLFDESSNIRRAFWELGVTQARLRVAISNPRVLSGWFRECFPNGREDENTTIRLPSGARRRLITIDAEKCRNVFTGKEEIPGQITREAFAQIMANPNPLFGRVYGHGLFPTEDLEVQLIGHSWLPRHRRAHKRLAVKIRVDALGLDVADSEKGDETVMAAGGEDGVRCLFARRKAGTMRTVGWVLRVCREKLGIPLEEGQTPIVVDADGIGKGVADRLEEQGCWVIYHNGSALAEDKRNYLNCRAETWGKLAERLDPAGPYAARPWALPAISKLSEDLVAQEKEYGSDAFRMSLMPKDRKRGDEDRKTVRQKLGGRSPDRGDAVAMLWRGVRELLADEAAGTIQGEITAIAPDEVLEGTRRLHPLIEAALPRPKRKKKQPAGPRDFDRELDEMIELYDERLREVPDD